MSDCMVYPDPKEISKIKYQIRVRVNYTIGHNRKTKKSCSSNIPLSLENRWSDSTDIEGMQQQLGRMADFLHPVTFSVFDL